MAMWTEDPNPMFGASLPQFLMAICTLAVPWMLPLGPESELTWPILAYFHGFSQDFLRIPKPYILSRQQRRTQRGPSQRFGSDGLGGHMALSDEESLLCEEEEEEEEDFDLTECVIHQVGGNSPWQLVERSSRRSNTSWAR